jgi:ubiquitin carboxyl-terminal hydrolase L3
MRFLFVFSKCILITRIPYSVLDSFPLCGYASCHVFQRAVFLEKDDAMARAHSLAANAGVTEVLVSLHM